MPPTGYQGKCHYCSLAVYTANGVAFGVVGWVGVRAQGGANQIILRTRVPGKVAHLACAKHAADLAKRGISASQETLVFE